MTTVRPAAVAGTFYPGQPEVLRDLVDGYLAQAGAQKSQAHAMIVPHAGLMYSGPVAASAYAQVAQLKPKPTRVVLLGPSHHVAFSGLALPGCEAFETPLGRIPVDLASAALLRALPQVRELARAHALEHSLELQLPFLQRVLGDFSLLPLVVGEASPQDVSAVLELVWGGPETLVLVSSDLSHFHPWQEAKRLDEKTAKRIELLDANPLDGEDACGCRPINGLLEFARQRALRCTTLDLRNSGDTAGERSRVVGYGAFVFEEARS